MQKIFLILYLFTDKIVTEILSMPCFYESWLQEEMTNALATMRVDYDQVINIKNVDQSKNPLIARRKKGRPVETVPEEEGATPMQ